MKYDKAAYAAKNKRRRALRKQFQGRTLTAHNREMGRLLAMGIYDRETGRIAAAPKGGKKPLIDA